jgi:hypothetical protein
MAIEGFSTHLVLHKLWAPFGPRHLMFKPRCAAGVSLARARDTTRNAHLPVYLDLPAHDEEVRPRCVPGVWLNSLNKILIYIYVEGEGKEGSEVESV